MRSATDMITSQYPAYPEDVFSSEALKRPFGHYRRIRDLGPVVRLKGVEAVALSRFDDVRTALQTPEIFISGEGNGFNDVWNMPKGPELIRMDGQEHRRLRRHLTQPMTPAALAQHRDMLKTMITNQVRKLADGNTFEAIEGIAKHLPLAAISYLVGLPEAGRQNMLRWATAIFNMVGPASPALNEDLQILLEFRDYMLSVDPAQLPENGWAKALFDAARDGKLTVAEAQAVLGGFVAPSLDTTINAKSNLLYNLAINPAEWDKLRRNPSLISSTVMEGVRHSAVVRWFARVTSTDYQRRDIFLPQGTRVMLMFGSANRDERHYPDPDAFKVDRNPQDQLGWGSGPHICAGLHLARLEMEVLLEALVENIETMEADEPVFSANRGLFGLQSLPMRMTPTGLARAN
ncbi:cytochrome P450 [Lichenicoccus sp.]|uniref:cytochrome P450 n=1 Tax=Lichenicoccus sp. TaxID=2781899 RepID=UPI003D0CFE4B